MKLENCGLYLFLSIFVTILALTLQSNEIITEDLSFLQCHWDPFNTASTRECKSRCSGYFGFWDEISNQLICYHREGTARPVNEANEHCVCGHVPENKRIPSTPCVPKIEYKDITNIRQCALACANIKTYKYVTEGSVKVSYCEQSYKVVPHNLQMMPGYGLKINGKYLCQCAVHSGRVFGKSTQQPEKDNREIEKYTEKLCKMEEFDQSHKNRCISNCNRARGFIPHDGGELFCYHYQPRTGQVISSDRCQCGLIITTTAGDTVHPCVPEKIYTTTSDDPNECWNICFNMNVFVFSIHPNEKITRCEHFDREPTESFGKLKAKIGIHRTVPTRSGSIRSVYSCQCGVGSLLPRDLNNEIYSSGLECDEAKPAIIESSKSRRKKREYAQVADFRDVQQKRNGSDLSSLSHQTNRMGGYTNPSHYAIRNNTGNDVNVFEEIENDEDFQNLSINLSQVINRNSSLQAARSHELVQSDDVYIPSPLPIPPDIQSLFQIMDNVDELEKPVGDLFIPSLISHADIGSYSAVPRLSTHDNTNSLYNNIEGGSSSRVPHYQVSSDDFPNIPAHTYLFPNGELQPFAPYSPTFVTNQMISPWDIGPPSTHYYHDSGSLESIFQNLDQPPTKKRS